MSSSSWLGMSTKAARKGCALRVESSPEMVMVFPTPWNGMRSTSTSLGAGENGRI